MDPLVVVSDFDRGNFFPDGTCGSGLRPDNG